VNIPLSNNDAKHLNNVESGGKTIEDEENDSNNRFDMRNCCQNFVDRTFTKKQLNRKLPITEWLPKYNVECFVSDLIAGITVALTVIPQGIAYALIAELPPQYGLYSAFMGCFLYIFFGSSKDITVGPTAIMALMTAQYAATEQIDADGNPVGPYYAVLLAFLSGVITLVFGILRLGVVIDFISVPVIAGFTSAAAITIASGQVKSIFGLTLVDKVHKEGIVWTWRNIVVNFHTIRVNDTVLGIFCVILLLLMRAMKNNTWFDTPDDMSSATRCQTVCTSMSPKMRMVLSKTIWVLSTARNAVVVIICALIAYGFDPVLPEKDVGTDMSHGHHEPVLEDHHSNETSHHSMPSVTHNTTFILTGNIQRGLPAFQSPPFSVNISTGNATHQTFEMIGFSEMVSELGSAIIILPLLVILENVAIAKAFAGGKPVDANQEMIALGLCNLFGSFVQSMPTTGSFSRTAVNCASGVKTPGGGIWTGALVIFALALLMPLCAYIPKAALGAVIITAVIFSVEYEVVRPMWKSKKLDLIPAFVTFFCCLFWALEFGILVGVGIQVFFILYNSARPSIVIETQQLHPSPESEYIWVSPDRALIFPSTNYVRNIINKAAVKRRDIPVVLDCTHISSADFTTAKGFKGMISDFKSRSQPIIFYNTHSSVLDTFLGVNVEDFTIVHSLEELHNHLHALIGNPNESSEYDRLRSVSNPTDINVHVPGDARTSIEDNGKTYVTTSTSP